MTLPLPLPLTPASILGILYALAIAYYAIPLVVWLATELFNAGRRR